MDAKPLPTESSKFSKILRAWVVFFLCWLTGFAFSYLRMYCRWGWPSHSHFLIFLNNQLFFYSQTALPHSLSIIGDNTAREIASVPVILCVSILFWLGIGVAFAWLVHRLRLFLTIPLALVSIFVALLAAQAFLYLFTIKIEVLGP